MNSTKYNSFYILAIQIHNNSIQLQEYTYIYILYDIKIIGAIQLQIKLYYLSCMFTTTLHCLLDLALSSMVCFRFLKSTTWVSCAAMMLRCQLHAEMMHAHAQHSANCATNVRFQQCHSRNKVPALALNILAYSLYFHCLLHLLLAFISQIFLLRSLRSRHASATQHILHPMHICLFHYGL